MRDETLENVLGMLGALTEELNKEKEKQKDTEELSKEKEKQKLGMLAALSENQKTTLDSLNKRVTYIEKTIRGMKEDYTVSTGKIGRYAGELDSTVRKIVKSAMMDNAHMIMKNQTDEVVERVVEIVHSTYELSQGVEVAKEPTLSGLSSLPPQRREDPRYYPLSWYQAIRDEKHEAYGLQQLATPLEIEEGTGNYGRCRALTRKGYRCRCRSPLTKVPTGHLLAHHYVRLEKYLCNSHNGDMGIDNHIGALMREILDKAFGED